MKKLIFLLLIGMVAATAEAQFLTQPVYGTLQAQADDESPGTLVINEPQMIMPADEFVITENYQKRWQDPVLYATVTEEITTGVYLKSRYRCTQSGNVVNCKLLKRNIQPYSPVRLRDKIQHMNDGYSYSQAMSWL